MSKFRVGQRVRVKYATTEKGRACVGREAVVVAFCGEGYEIDVSGVPTHANYPYWLADPDQLEPATDSYDVTTWDQCAWKPEHLRAEA